MPLAVLVERFPQSQQDSLHYGRNQKAFDDLLVGREHRSPHCHAETCIRESSLVSNMPTQGVHCNRRHEQPRPDAGDGQQAIAAGELDDVLLVTSHERAGP